MKPRGLRCDIYRPAHGDCSNGGISGRADRVTLIGPGIPEIFPATDEAPAVELGVTGGSTNVRPVVEETTWWMFGGCFVWTSDSRFPSRYPIPLHDRTESAELSEYLSR